MFFLETESLLCLFEEHLQVPEIEGLPACWYGQDCYRKNPNHREQFSHTVKPKLKANQVWLILRLSIGFFVNSPFLLGFIAQISSISKIFNAIEHVLNKMSLPIIQENGVYLFTPHARPINFLSWDRYKSIKYLIKRLKVSTARPKRNHHL